MKHFVLFTLFAALMGGSLQSQNVMISNSNYPEEPSIKINPKNPRFIVAGANLNNYFFSSDTGRTWQQGILTSPYGVWGDPVIDVDTAGHFYFFHLSNPPTGSWIDRIVCQKSTNNGQTWSPGTFTGLNGTKAQDKHWSVVDRNTNTIYLTWTQFDVYGSSNAADSSIILFSKSTDGGETWTTPVRINKKAGDCIDSDNTVEGAVPAIGPQGEIYVTWAGPAGIRFDRSTDGGLTWLDDDILIDPMPGGWDYDIPGISRCNGLPITRCDLSGGPFHGTIYVNWTDQRNGSNDTDVWLAKSTDGGNTWSAPKRVNDDAPGKHQFFTWMDLDQATGWLWFVFYDRRNYNDNHTDVFLAVSMDGGETFINKKISESPFLPNAGVFFGDYTNISAYNNIIRPIWTRLQGGQLSVWTDITPVDQILTGTQQKDTANPAIEIETYPNPANEKFYLSFKIHASSQVTLKIYDPLGRCVATPIDSVIYSYGKHVIELEPSHLGLAAGNYLCVLSYENKTVTRKITIN